MPIGRVAYVVKVFPIISETFIAREIVELRRRGTDVRIFSVYRPWEEWHHHFIDEEGLMELVEYDVQRYKNILVSFRPDLFHAHFATESTAAAWQLSREYQLPFSFTAHGFDIYQSPPADFLARATAAAAVVTVSQANARYMEQTFAVPPEKIHVIPCGVSIDSFSPSSAVGDPVPTIVCVARLEPVKRLDILLEACAVLQSKHLPFQCVIIGGGSCQSDLERVRQRLNLEDRVRLTGALDEAEVRRWWQKASIAALTSDSEGMPVCLMEAAACGVPAVATRVGGVPELVADAVTGILVNPGDATGVADALERLLLNRAMRVMYGEASRARAVDHFSLDRQIDLLLAVWARAIH